FRPLYQSQPMPVVALAKRLDRLAGDLRDDGLVLVKQPDVFSQARLTHYRTDFETQMKKDLETFHLVLSARIGRLDAATTIQTTSLAGALSSFSSATGNRDSKQKTDNEPGASYDPSKTSFGSLTVDPSLKLGVEPTVYLDEKKRFLEHLNQ